MLVGPGPLHWNRAIIWEEITLSTNDCPNNINANSACSGGQSFTVGPPQPSGVAYGINIPPASIDEFIDFHTFVWPTDLLRGTGRDSCVITCSQTYSACTKPIGKFEIKRTLTHGTINGTAVTFVETTKTPK